MFVIARDCLSEPAELRKDRIIQPIVRKAVSLGKSLGPILYLVTVGVIATWVIGVFFGVGFFLLMHHHSEKPGHSGRYSRRSVAFEVALSSRTNAKRRSLSPAGEIVATRIGSGTRPDE
jgi:hypothetical protein